MAVVKKQGATFRDFIAKIKSEGKMVELSKPASLKLELTARRVFDPATVYKKK